MKFTNPFDIVPAEMADKLARMKQEKDALIAEGNEANVRATQDRAKVSEGEQAKRRLDQFDIDRNIRDAEIYRLNELIKKKEASRIRPRPRQRQSPFTSGKPELVALARNVRNAANEAEDIARRSASASRLRS